MQKSKCIVAKTVSQKLSDLNYTECNCWNPVKKKKCKLPKVGINFDACDQNVQSACLQTYKM